MTELQLDSPLKWPTHILQTERLKRQFNHNFQQNMTEPEALAFLQDEVTRTPEITGAKLTCNAVNINSPIATQYLSKNPGASLIVRIDGKQATLCCDRWQTIAHNIYALHLAIRQFRQLSEWGIGSLPVLLHGFTDAVASTAAGSTTNAGSPAIHNWQKVLGLGAGATLEDANAVYRNRAKAIGETDPDGLQTLNLAIQEARRHFGSN